MYLDVLFRYWWCALLLLVVLHYGRLAFRHGLRSLPGPLTARFTGLYRLSMVIHGDSPKQYRELHEKYGSIVRTGPMHVSVSDPSMIPTIYGIGSKYVKSPFYSVFSISYQGSVMDSLFTTRDPDYHKALRSPVAQLYSMTNMKNFEQYADECTGIFIDAMRSREGEDIDLSVWVQWYAFDVIACITFQRRFGFMEQQRDVDGMMSAIDDSLQYVKVIGQFPQLHPWLLGNKRTLDLLKKVIPHMPDPIDRIIKVTEEEVLRYDREEKRPGRTDFLSQLRMKEAKDGKLSQRDIMNHLTNNLLAGSDTTAISLRAIFYYLIKNPRTYEKLVVEILDADRTGNLSTFVKYEECLKLPYLQAVMKEAMRIHPGVGFPLERIVPAEGATIGNVMLPAGTNISVMAPVIHHDKEVFGATADEFRPERWLEASTEELKLMDRNYLAFGHGARTCIGRNISIMEMGKFVPQILRHFDLEWASETPTWKTDTAWFWKQSDVIVRFRSRRGT